MIFVDTNYFVRYFLKDIPSQFRVVKKLFSDGAIGKTALFTSTIVVFEISWVFGSFYGKTKSEVIAILRKVLAMNFIEFAERGHIEQSIELYERTLLEFEDCYNLVFSREKGVKEFATFDKKIMRYLKTMK